MGRKRKQPNTAIARVTRLHTAQPPRDRTVSVHTTSTGRLGQSTTYVPSDLPSTAGAVSGVGEAVPGGEQLSPDFAASGDPTGIEDTDESLSMDDKEPKDLVHIITMRLVRAFCSPAKFGQKANLETSALPLPLRPKALNELRWQMEMDQVAENVGNVVKEAIM